MNLINRAASSIFDLLLAPFELLGDEVALVMVSGVFGIAALLLFKRISWQAGIKGTKDKIKGNMIAIRIYQDDLVIVGQSVLKVLFRNAQYLGLNFGPILPLFAPMALVAAQFVVRYGFDPLPIVDSDEEVAALLPGEGTLIEIELKADQRADVARMTVRLPEGIQAIYPRPAAGGTPVLMRSLADGKAYIEVVARKPVQGEIVFVIDGQRAGSKEIVAGTEAPRRMQPERVSSFWWSWLWPAEDTFGSDLPIERVVFVYPERSLALPFLPAGPLGILLGFFVASVLFGVAVLKPLNIQI